MHRKDTFTESQKVDSIFFKVSNPYEYHDWVETSRDSANILRVSILGKSTDYFWSANKKNLMHLKKISNGMLENPRGTNPEEAKTYGKWFFYGDADIGLYEIGYYKNGVKDSIWYTSYEDYPIPEIKFYRNGVSIDYDQPITINEPGLVEATGSKLTKEGVPLGKWVFISDSTLLTTCDYALKKDSIFVKFSTIDSSNNKIIDKGEFQEALEY